MAADATTEIRADLAAFADDDEEVIVDRNGECLLVRGGEEISFNLVEEENRLLVELDGVRLSYRDFLAHRLAKLDVLAERIVAKRPPLTPYIDGCGTLEVAAADPTTGGALELLESQCSRHVPFVSRVLFVTADAGQGKTALLRQFQHYQARRYIDGEASYLFWHVDLQGRQLLRLSEALMGDLGDLRFAGLWMPGIIRLLRHRALVLAIDGFDELAAEQGGSDALGALALLVQQMGDRGTIAAASRRTFFDTEDYVSRARLFSRTGGGDCQFDQLSLAEWGPDEAHEYLRKVAVEEKKFQDADATYEAIVQELGSADHPMLTRPFLLAQVARGILRFDLVPADFIRGMDDPYRGVGAVIEAFVDREVSDKWKHAETGEPYLSREQHLRLLSDVAEEMFRSQRSTLSVEVVETLATLLLDEWGIDQVRQQQILDMVKMHVLLTPPADGDFRTRTFGHEEFLAWFTAYALKDRLLRLRPEGAAVSHDLLSIAQLSDATASYVCALIERTPQQVRDILEGLTALVRREWRPTYLQLNVGTLIPYLLDGIESDQRVEIDAEVVYASVVFEGSRLKGVTIRNGTFVNATFARVQWHDVQFEHCDMGEPVFDRRATYDNVALVDCMIEGVRIIDDSGEETREYAPERVVAALRRRGVETSSPDTQETLDGLAAAMPEGEARKLVRRILNMFRRTTFLSEATVQHRFPRDSRRVIEEILPLMQEHGIVKPKPWRGSGKQLAWGPDMSLDAAERADGHKDQPLHAFWAEVDKLDHA